MQDGTRSIPRIATDDDPKNSTPEIAGVKLYRPAITREVVAAENAGYDESERLNY
jgi:hypothetical protein